MKDVETLVSVIDFKLKKVVANQHILRTESQTLKNEIQILKTENLKFKENIKQLEEKIKILRLSKTLETKEGNVEAKLKINELVREIDKCIGLLNT
ncbi:MAG: hypothetical protein NT004_13945 [Bacteroidetes bacterium]|nr:hypothetical protein [Bacteroidota bacterium]